MKSIFMKCMVCITTAMLLAGSIATAVLAEETYTANTMRLLQYTGSVELTEDSGESVTLMKSLRIDTSATLKTGDKSSASIGMDSSKVVTLGQNTEVELTKKSSKMKITLTEGNLLLDVKEKLKDDESLDVVTSTVTMGIRGTILCVKKYPLPEFGQYIDNQTEKEDSNFKSSGQRITEQGIADLLNELNNLPDGGANCYITVVGLLEGSTDTIFTNTNGQKQSVRLPAGMKVTLIDTNNDGVVDKEPVVDNVTVNDLTDIQKETIAKDSQLKERVKTSGIEVKESDNKDYTADENEAVFKTPIAVTAQSASKLFDGSELTYTSDVVVEGVPAGYTYTATATGSQTNAGQGENPVDFHIYDSKTNKDVTSKFTNITITPGVLTVDPAPLHAWSGSASKVYDGTPLTCNDTKLTFSAGYESRTVSALNLSYVVTEQKNADSSDQNASLQNNADSSNQTISLQNSQTLYGITGTVVVHGSNPITGEMRDIPLKVGQRLTVYLYDENNKSGSIQYKVEKVSENQIPTQILRIYRDNRELAEAACKEAGWDIKTLEKLFEQLPAETAAGTTEDGIVYPAGTDPDNMMQDTTNVRINIDTELEHSTNRALNKEEAHFTPIKIDPQIQIVTSASITNVGTISNDFTINWGTALEKNYNLTKEVGTLTVTEAPLTVTTGSAVKRYDGKPLTNSDAEISGLVNGETATVITTGSITEVGTTPNTYTINWGSASENNYSLSDSIGTLRVTEANAPITITVSVKGKTYDGTPLTVDSEIFKDASSDSITSKSTTVLPASVLTVLVKPVTLQNVNSGFGSVMKLSSDTSTTQRDSDSAFTVTGLPEGYGFKAKISGSRTDAGTSKIKIESYQILDAAGNDITGSLSNVVVEGGDLTIEPAEVTITTGSASRQYDGTALTNAEASIKGLVSDETATVTATGSVTNIGSKKNTYTIDWGETNKDNYTVTENIGTLKVTKNNDAITFTANDASKPYDGTALTADGVTAVGLPASCTFTATASGSQTDAGRSSSSVTSYSIQDAEGNDVTSNFTNIFTTDGTLTVEKAAVTVTADTLEKAYDGTPLNGTVSVTGLADADKDKVTAESTASITDVGTTDNTYTFDWGTVNQDNYTLTEVAGTLTVTKNDTEIIFTTASDEKTFDGLPLTNDSVTVENLPEGFTYQCSAGGGVSNKDAGTYENNFTSHEYEFYNDDEELTIGWRYAAIKNADGVDVTDNFTNIKLVKGTLTINPLPVTFEIGCYDSVYSGYTVLPDGVNGQYEDGSDVEAVSYSLLPEYSEVPTSISAVFNLTGDAQVKITCDGQVNAGSYTITPDIEFVSGTEGNYSLSFTNTAMTIDPVNITVDLGSPVVDYDGNTHGGSISAAYANGEYAGWAPIETERNTGEAGSQNVLYTLFTGDTLRINAGFDGPEPGTYTLSCINYITSGNSDNFSFSVTGDTLTINETTTGTENPVGAEATVTPSVTPDSSEDAQLSDSDKKNSSASDKTDGKDTSSASTKEKASDDKTDASDDKIGTSDSKDADNDSGTSTDKNLTDDSSDKNTDEGDASESSRENAGEGETDESSDKNTGEDVTDESSDADANENAADQSSESDSEDATEETSDSEAEETPQPESTEPEPVVVEEPPVEEPEPSIDNSAADSEVPEAVPEQPVSDAGSAAADSQNSNTEGQA